jgi:hypothetical protein
MRLSYNLRIQLANVYLILTSKRFFFNNTKRNNSNSNFRLCMLSESGYGTIDWERLMKNIGRSSYSRVISFEMSMAHTPFKDDPDTFLADARKRCLEVARLAEI